MKFIYKLTNGAGVHPECREPYNAARPSGSSWIAIDKAIHADLHTGELPPNSMFRDGRFELCAHCKSPVLEYLETGFVALNKGSL